MLARHLRTSRLLLRPYLSPATSTARTLTTTVPRLTAVAVPRPNETDAETAARTAKERWGHNLPVGELAKEEYEVYVRMYGEPIKLVEREELEALELKHEMEALGIEEPVDRIRLFDVDGTEIIQEEEPAEEAEEIHEEEEEIYEEEEEELELPEEDREPRPARLEQISPALRAKLEEAGVHIIEHTQAELEALERGEEYPEDEEDPGRFRTHPLTALGQFGTKPGTIRIPEGIQNATKEILQDVPNKHLDEAAMKILCGPKLPRGGLMHPKADQSYRGIAIDTGNVRMSDMEANVYVATQLPGLYAQCLSALTELRKRLGPEWVLGGESEAGVKRVLDVGTAGAGVLAWRSVLEAERGLRKEEADERDRTEEQMREVHTLAEAADKEPIPEEAEEDALQRATVVVGPPTLRYRMSKMLDNTSFIPRLPDKPSESQPRKPYDLIIATNTLGPMGEFWKRKEHIENLTALLNPDGGVLLLIEKGTPWGFEAIAGAREQLLESTQPPLIIAPCTNSGTCPLFKTGPAEHVRRDFCAFPQRYERPSYLQRIIKAKSYNHEDLTFSYLSIRAGRQRNIAPKIDPEAFSHTEEHMASPYPLAVLRDHAYTMPRLVFTPMKRRGHVILDVCTPSAEIERWTVPRSWGKKAYRDARKSQWGDLWALGAKSKILRKGLVLGNERRARGGIKLKQETILDASKDDMKIVEREVDRKGGKKRNPGKRERERRQAQREAQKARAAMKEGLEGVETWLEKRM